MNVSRPLALVSGGPDSVALLRVLVEMAAEPTVLHVEHGVRGEESLADAEFVGELCATLGVAYELRRLELGDVSNFQEEARRERYRVAEEVADALWLESIATGHTADDVAETVLMNLARGAGLRGLAGIPPVQGRVVRPLISVGRKDVLEYLGRLKQPYRLDRSNLTGKYARNRVRQDVLPTLEELYPGAGANVARGAAILREDLEVLESLAAGVVYRRDPEVIIPFEELMELPHALRRYAVRRAYSMLTSGAPGLEYALVESVLGLLEEVKGTRTLDLPGGVVTAARTTGELAFYRAESVEKGSVDLEEGRRVFGEWEIEVRGGVEFDAAAAARPEVVYLDAARGPYRVRTVREGDSIRPLGLGGSKKALRAMMDRGVPKDLRRRMPVVVDAQDTLAWIFEGELSEKHKIGGETENILKLEVGIFRADV